MREHLVYGNPVNIIRIGIWCEFLQHSFFAFQSKQNTKLLASTQIHAFNNEDSSARIGQRVPVTTATISNGFNNGGTGTGNNNGFLSNVVNYEQVGLTLKFKPIVFPNQDVQVAMEIESKDVVACSRQVIIRVFQNERSKERLAFKITKRFFWRVPRKMSKPTVVKDYRFSV